MNTGPLTDTLTTLLRELLDGAQANAAYMLNAGDPGLLGSLDRLTAADASAASLDGASIAAHVDHLAYGISLMNQWSTGVDPFATADWSASWRRTSVSDAEWQALRDALRRESHTWLDAIRTPRDVTVTELNGIVGSLAHLAYHLGAIRQINQRARGPRQPEPLR